MRSTIALTTLALLAIPSAAYAVDDAPAGTLLTPVSVTTPVDPTPRAIVVRDPSVVELQTHDENRALRWGLDPLAGIGAGFGLGVAGAFPGFIVSLVGLTSCSLGLFGPIGSAPSSGCGLAITGAVMMMVGGNVGIVFGSALGVTAVGARLRGRGNFWMTALGALIGDAAGFALFVAGSATGLTPLTVTGAVLNFIVPGYTGQAFYELSSNAAVAPLRGSRQAMRITPTVLPVFTGDRMTGAALGVTAIHF